MLTLTLFGLILLTNDQVIENVRYRVYYNTDVVNMPDPMEKDYYFLEVAWDVSSVGKDVTQMTYRQVPDTNNELPENWITLPAVVGPVLVKTPFYGLRNFCTPQLVDGTFTSASIGWNEPRLFSFRASMYEYGYDEAMAGGTYWKYV